MFFFYSLLNLILNFILIFDTLGFYYQISINKAEKEEFKRICFTWVLFIAVNEIPFCKSLSFFGLIIRIIQLLVKVALVLPLTGVTMKLYNSYVGNEKIEEWIKEFKESIKEKLKLISYIESNSCGSKPMEDN